MYGLLLAIIYLAFISLGLPDSLLGAGWPVMHGELGVSLSYAGAVTMIIACGTVVSSLVSDRLVRKVGTGAVTAGSVLLSALSLLGFSLAGDFWMLCVLAVPYGLAAGAVDAVLNNYVALHYAGRHMTWLHCFWGIGAAVSPYLMGFCISGGAGWRSGYRLVFGIQLLIAAVVFASLSLWNTHRSSSGGSTEPAGRRYRFRELLAVRGVKPVLISFFCYCALETTTGLWASSYLVTARGVEPQLAARFGSLFYLGITVGRFVCGFVTERFGDLRMIRLGTAVVLTGMLLVAVPLEAGWLALVGLLLIGLGCAPIYPCIIHATPASFGAERSQAIIGLQMAFAYIGNTLVPPLFGVLVGVVSVGMYPFFLLVFGVAMLAATEWKNRACASRTEHCV